VTKIGVQVGKIVIKIIIKNYKLLEGRGGEGRVENCHSNA
jgi:hypothetical protein